MKKTPIAPLFETDAYKQSHILFLEEGTEKIYSNYTNRSSRIEGITHVVNFGLQAFIQNYIMDSFEDFFAADEDEVIRLYEARVKGYLGEVVVKSDHIRNLHRKGYLPLEFKQVKEGTLVPLQVPSLTIENTDPEFAWLTNFIETALSSSIWHPSSVATIALQARLILEDWAKKTGSPLEGVAYQFHDFSMRGQTSISSSGSAGSGHLTSFIGSDALPAIEWIDYLYPGDNGQILASIPATEHSTMVAGTAYESEEATYRRIITEDCPTGFVSIVSDTYSIWSVVEKGGILDRIREDVLGREGRVVVRPDSGDPVDIVTGTARNFGEGQTSEEKGVIELLWDVFGGTVNAAGFKVLDSHLGLIYGDGITLDRLDRILERLAQKGFASENFVAGVGSFSYQVLSRDSIGGSAVKAVWTQIKGKGYNLMKDPITAKGQSKKSATGRLAVFRDENKELYLIQKATPEQEAQSELATVWRDGEWIRKQSFADVRATLKLEKTRVFG